MGQNNLRNQIKSVTNNTGISKRHLATLLSKHPRERIA